MTPPFKQITLLHGKDNLPSGSVLRLENLLRAAFPNIEYARPLLPKMTAKDTCDFVKKHYMSRIKPNSMLIGLDRGGLIACDLQSSFPALHLSVVAINSPTREIGIQASPCETSYSRMALYSSAQLPKDCNDWHFYAPLNYDVQWLSKGIAYYPVAYLITAFMGGRDMEKEVAMMFPSNEKA